MKKQILAGILAGLLVLSLAACGSAAVPGESGAAAASSEASDSPEASTLHVAMMTDPEGLDPQKTAAASTYLVSSNVYEPLILIDQNWEVQPRLATSWEVAEDHRSVLFHLKRGVKFHDGREMTAEDVKYSIERLHEEDSPKKKYYQNITATEIYDDYTIRFLTEKPDADLLSSFAYPWSVIVPKDSGDSLKTKPVGTGAYRFVSWTPQQELSLTRNEDYHDIPASIENIHYQIIPDNNSAMVGLLSGEIDLVDLTGTPIDPIRDNPAVSLYQKSLNSVTIVGMNLDNPLLKNPLLRQAMASAIDKDEIIRSVNQGFGDKVGSYLPYGTKEYIDTNAAIPYDPEHAKQLLAEAGYPDGFTIGLTLPKSYPVYLNTGLILADQLERVGIHCEIEVVAWADWMQKVYTDKNYDMTVMANSGRLNAYDFIARFHSQSGDYISDRSGEADSLLDSLKNELDEEKRSELIRQFQTLISEQVPVIPIETQQRIYAMSSRLKGYVMYPSETTEYKLLHFEQQGA